MRVATFGPSTAWLGRGIDYDGVQFILEGHGSVPPEALADYDRRGQIIWAYDGLREWALAPAAGGAGRQAEPGPAPPGALYRPIPHVMRPTTPKRRPSVPSAVIVLVAVLVVIMVAVVVATLPAQRDQAAAPFVSTGPTDEDSSLVQTGPGGGRPGTFTVTLRSDTGDSAGGGVSYVYTQEDATLSLEPDGNSLNIILTPAHWASDGWEGDFQEPSRLSVLEEGRYRGLSWAGLHHPSRGGFEWHRQGDGGDDVTGWFAIERLAYRHGKLSALTLRFEQHCDGAGPGLHGLIRWRR
jgi:hypothetical protein